jgi:hypothetical protein
VRLAWLRLTARLVSTACVLGVVGGGNSPRAVRAVARQTAMEPRKTV